MAFDGLEKIFILMFDGDEESNDYWSIRIKTIFISHDLWEMVEDDYEEPQSNEV